MLATVCVLTGVLLGSWSSVRIDCTPADFESLCDQIYTEEPWFSDSYASVTYATPEIRDPLLVCERGTPPEVER